VNGNSDERQMAIVTGASSGIGKKHTVVIPNLIALASPAEDYINWRPTDDQDHD
jgi:hypothetical protein